MISINKNEVNMMYNFFNPKRNRMIAGIIAGVLAACMIVTAILSFI